MALVAFAATLVPAIALLGHFQAAAAALEQDHFIWQLVWTMGGLAVTLLLQVILAQEGCFGVCGFPPIARSGARLVLTARVLLLSMFLAVIVIGALTLLGQFELHVGLVLSLALGTLWVATFNGLYVALGYEQAVPRRLRFMFAPDTFWMLARLSGRKYPAERSCVDVLRSPDLPTEDRLLALELIALRPWVAGGLEALNSVASAVQGSHVLSSRAREVLSAVGR